MNLVNFRSFTGKKTRFFSAATAVKGVAKHSSVLRGFAMNKIIRIIKKALSWEDNTYLLYLESWLK